MWDHPRLCNRINAGRVARRLPDEPEHITFAYCIKRAPLVRGEDMLLIAGSAYEPLSMNTAIILEIRSI